MPPGAFGIPAPRDGLEALSPDLLDCVLVPGSAFDPVLFEFTTSITNDQSAEIERMNALLATLSSDPRAGLAARLRRLRGSAA